MSVKNYVSYNDATTLMTKIGQKFAALNGAYVIRGNSTFANLPAVLTKSMNGYVYNVTDDFTSDARFVEGAGKKYPAGTNIVIVDLSTYTAVTPAGSENPSEEGWYELVGGKYVLSQDTAVDNEKTYYEYEESVKFDVISSFIDVDDIEASINAVAAMITGAFDETASYNAGDIVVYEHGLYKFNTDHAAGAWDVTEVDAVTVIGLLNTLKTDVNTRINNIDSAIGDAFSTAADYEIGNIVVHEDKIYKFKAEHTAGAWDPEDVDEVNLIGLIDNAEPDSLTTEQINALLALLD